jgi:hypothetical protein
MAKPPLTAGKRWSPCLGLLLSTLACGLLLGVPNSQAGTAINAYTAEASTNQAGGHPDVTVRAEFDNRETEEGKELPPPSPEECFCEDAETISFELPTGFIGNPNAIAECTLADFSLDLCPVESQIGDAEAPAFGRAPIFNLEPHPNEAGLSGFVVPVIQAPAFTSIHARTGSDYGLDATTSGLLHSISSLRGIELHLWGVPALPVHDPVRFPANKHTCETGNVPYPEPCLPPTPSNALPTPFLSNPTTCGVPLTATLVVHYYSGQTARRETSVPGTVGCDRLAFNPSLTALPTTGAADSPSGLDIDLSVPQPQDAEVPSPSEIRAMKVTLPAGMSLNPGAANGKSACGDTLLNFENEEAAECPEFAKVGTLELESAVLPAPLPGAIYIGQPHADHQFRIFLAANGFGTHVKLKGDASLDPKTGQIEMSFVDLPQSPLQDFKLHFFGSERGIFATPTQCGTYQVKAEYLPWDSLLSTQTSTSSFEIDSGPSGQPCPGASRPFSPHFAAGTSDNTAGDSSPMAVTIDREDGTQFLNTVSTKLPPGLIASLRSVGECSEPDFSALLLGSHTGLDELANPICPAASQVGTVIVGSGPGSRPIYNEGKVYLAGPYKGAPVSLVIVVPAVGGPYDLGNAVVRAAVFVDPVTTQVNVVSDQLPSILAGVPLRVRSLLFELDRPGFMRLPSNCRRKVITSQIVGEEDAQSSPSAPYQVANCADLTFGPKLSIKLTGSTKQAGDPALTATLAAKPGEANISRTRVTLPPTELIDNAHIGNVCTRVRFNEGETPGKNCPPSSVLGFAKAITPLLDRPLEGPVYLRASGRAVPDIVAALNGQIDIVLDGRVDSVHGRLRTSFETVPDAPVSKFTLHFDGGSKGLLENSPKLCAHVQHFTAVFIAQNGKTADQKPLLKTPCRKRDTHKNRAHHSRRAHR